MVKLTSQIFLLEMKIKYLIDKQSINRSSLGFFFIIMSCLQQTQYQNFVRSGSIFFLYLVFLYRHYWFSILFECIQQKPLPFQLQNE